MPIRREPGRSVEMWVSVTHLGFKVDSSLKGKSKAIRILDCVEDFLKEPFASMRSPLNILAPWGPTLGQLQHFSIRHRIGFTRSLTCHLILLAVHDMRLDDAHIKTVQNLLQPLFLVEATWEGAANIKDEVAKTIGGKMQLSEIKQLDPIQCAHAWSGHAKEEGLLYDAAMDTYLSEYRDQATGTQSISELEEKVIKLIPSQTEACQKKLAYHWQNFRVAKSGVPLSAITNDAWLYGTTPRDGTNALWVQVQLVPLEKRQFCVQRRMGIFLKGIKDAMRLGKKVNLKDQGGNFRDRMTDEVAYEIAAFFPTWHQTSSPS